MIRSGNIFANLPERLPEEEATVLAEWPGAVVERIVSTGQGSPPGFRYDQDWAEWVVVLAGAAELRIEGEGAARRLEPGDFVEIPPECPPSRRMDRSAPADRLARRALEERGGVGAAATSGPQFA